MGSKPSKGQYTALDNGFKEKERIDDEKKLYAVVVRRIAANQNGKNTAAVQKELNDLKKELKAKYKGQFDDMLKQTRDDAMNEVYGIINDKARSEYKNIYGQNAYGYIPFDSYTSSS
eukprot:CAMPEP_0201577808 /NCGR_PEP_ID=MMETSP0190_2-20130828/24349_1 /ASSEMBLY_ACC=CAM_ASM_000263 /TAXON_ID=37353 /ORGANISM="Rosalina sp." /LENGTH=116 /DNA_ID=CAMNT_0048010237 /DNA_START=23 /DNA_END=370 /DNA_ORIENTATION=+